MRILSAADLRRLVDMPSAIEAVRHAFAALSSGRAEVPVRTSVSVPSRRAVLLAMPGAVDSADQSSESGDRRERAIGAKLVTVFPDNARAGRPIIHAIVALLDGGDGRPTALIEGASLTALRTGAAGGLATDLLARKDAGIVAIFGAGVQARTQLEAVCAVRDITQVRIVGRDRARADVFAEWTRAQRWLGGATVIVAADPALAVRGADIITTATTSSVPVFPGSAVERGVHVNAVGAFQPQTREIDTDLIERAAVFVDSREAALAEAGDLVIPISERRFAPERIRAEIGDVVLGRAGRQSNDEITIFKSVGNAAQDVVVAHLAAARAVEQGVGVEVSLDGDGA
jgi:ornithine cyclodeaminase/alanine dehydrogenase-like protein (mu-crystallin family)